MVSLLGFSRWSLRVQPGTNGPSFGKYVLNPKPKKASCATRAVFGPPTHPPRARREGAPWLASQWVNRGAVLVSAFLSPHDATAIMEMDRDWGATYSPALACGVNKALQG